MSKTLTAMTAEITLVQSSKTAISEGKNNVLRQ